MKTLDEAVAIVMAKTYPNGDACKAYEESTLKAQELHSRFAELRQEVIDSEDIIVLVNTLVNSLPSPIAIQTAFLYGMMTGIEMERGE